ncbi:MAG: hypothetical protein WB947_00125 [Thermoplasmata archaeon]
MLSASDLEINVLEFRQRSFQFQRLATVAGREVALFSRTETETESQFRPKLIHLHLLVPQEWVVFDEPNDVLLVAHDGATIPVRLTEQVVEVGAERTEFEEQGIAWRRTGGPSGSYVYAPTELAAELLTAEAYAALGVT